MRFWDRDVPRWFCWVLGLALAAAFAVYGPQLNHPLLKFDDSFLITRNAAVQHLNLKTLFHVFTTYDPELYIPLTFLSYQVQVALFGMQPWAFHAVNLLLHMGSTVLVALLVLRLTRRPAAAIVAALVFCLHPLQVEAVLWASARKDVLSTLLSLSTILLYLRYRDDESRRGLLIACAITFVLALLAKVHAVVVPALLLVIDGFEGRKPHRKSAEIIGGFFALAGLFLLIAVLGKIRLLGETNFGTDVLLLCKSALFYLQAFFWPAHLSLLYSQSTPVMLASLEFLVPVLFVLGLATVALLARRKHPILALGVVWYLVALVPSVASFAKNGFLFFASDRYAYVAIIGVAIVVGWIFDLLLDRLSVQKLVLPLTVALVLLLGWGTVRQVHAWTDEETLFQTVVDRYPGTAMAWNNLAVEKMLKGQTDQAVALFGKAIELSPDYTVPYRNIANIAFDSGDPAAATQGYARVMEILRAKHAWTGEDVETASSYALLLESSGRPVDAFAILQETLQHAPQFGEAHYNVGIKLQQQGKMAEAVLELAQSVRLSPQHTDAWYHYAAVLAELGRLPEAMEALREVLWLDPESEKAREHYENMRKMVEG